MCIFMAVASSVVEKKKSRERWSREKREREKGSLLPWQQQQQQQQQKLPCKRDTIQEKENVSEKMMTPRDHFNSKREENDTPTEQ